MADTGSFLEDYGGEDASAQIYELKLFITGASPNSIRAVENLKAICDQYIPNRYQLEIIDIHQQKDLVEYDNVVAVPLLIKRSPGPERRLIGDMSNVQRVLKGLGLENN